MLLQKVNLAIFIYDQVVTPSCQYAIFLFFLGTPVFLHQHRLTYCNCRDFPQKIAFIYTIHGLKKLRNQGSTMVLLDFSRSETLAPMAWACGKFAAAVTCILMASNSVENGGFVVTTHVSTGILLALAFFEPAVDEIVLGSFCIFQELRHSTLLGTNLTVIRECTLVFTLRQYSFFCEGRGQPPEPSSYVWVCLSSGLWFLFSAIFMCLVSYYIKCPQPMPNSVKHGARCVNIDMCTYLKYPVNCKLCAVRSQSITQTSDS